jgi:hypothetical protein
LGVSAVDGAGFGLAPPLVLVPFAAVLFAFIAFATGSQANI